MPRKLISIKELLNKYRDSKELWKLDTKTTYKWITSNTINMIKSKLEQDNITISWD